MISHLDFLVSSSDELLSRATVSVHDPSTEQLLGTGFYASCSGQILTAAHVVTGHKDVLIRSSGGKQVHAPISFQYCNHAHDIAIIDSGLADCDALPIAQIGNSIPVRYFTRGFQFTDRGMNDALPLDGTITGRTSVEYEGYHLTDALVLANSYINHGTSGAPLFDPNSRAVVGVITSGFGSSPALSFAIPFDTLRSTWPPLQRLLLVNNTTVPRFGARVNYLGAKLICDVQRKSSVERLALSGLYRRTQIIERSSVTDALSDFCTSSKHMMPIIGRSGVGKTSVIANYAEADGPSLPLRLFLRGVDLKKGQDGVGALADAALAKLVTDQDFRLLPKITELALAARERGENLVLLLDGLNEAALKFAELTDAWIPRSVSGLSELSMKAVVTCRPEAWKMQEKSWPVGMLYSPPKADEEDILHRTSTKPETKAEREQAREAPFFLGDFTPEEAKLALESYDLSDTLSASTGLHPFMLTIAEEIKHELQAITFNQYALMDAFIRRKVEKSLANIDRAITQSIVLDQLTAVARTMLDEGSQALSQEEMLSVFHHDTVTIEVLGKEHIIVLESSGYRFQYDQVREYLQSGEVSPQAILRSLITPTPLYASSNKYSHGIIFHKMFRYLLKLIRRAMLPDKDRNASESTVCFAILRLLYQGSMRDFFGALSLISCATSSYPFTYGARYAQEVALLLLLRFRGSESTKHEYYTWVSGVIDNEVRNVFIDLPDAKELDLLEGVRRLDVNTSDKLHLYRKLLRKEWSAYWNADTLANKAWHEVHSISPEDHPSFGAEGHTFGRDFWKRPIAKQMEQLIQRDPEVALAVIFDWLSDAARIGEHIRGGHGGTVGEAAAICLYYFRNVRRSWFYRRLLADQTLMKAFPGGTRFLVEALAVRESDAILLTSFDLVEEGNASASSLARVVWSCMKRSPDKALALRAFGWCIAVFEEYDELETKLWMARSMFAEFAKWSDAAEQNPEIQPLLIVVDELWKHLQAPLECTYVAVHAWNGLAIRDDFSHVLLFDGHRAIQLIESSLHEGRSPSTELVQGIMDSMSGRRMRQAAARKQMYARMVQVLRICFDRGSEEVQVTLADRLQDILSHAGNPSTDYFFDADEIFDIGLAQLGLSVFSKGPPNVGIRMSHLAVSSSGMFKDEIMALVRDEELDEPTYSEFVHQFGYRVRFHGGRFAELTALRVHQRRLQWDHAMLRHVRVGDEEDDPLSEECVLYWRSLADGERSKVIERFLGFLSKRRSPREAAWDALRSMD